MVVGPNGSTAEKQFMSFIESCQGQCVAGVWVMQHMSRATPHSLRQAGKNQETDDSHSQGRRTVVFLWGRDEERWSETSRVEIMGSV